MLTGKCFSQFSLNHNKSKLLFISSSYHKHIRNMNLEFFSRVIMRLCFQKVLVFQITKCTFQWRTHLQSNYSTYVLSNHHFPLTSHFFSFFFFFLFKIFNMNFSFFFFEKIFSLFFSSTGIYSSYFQLFEFSTIRTNHSLFYIYCIYVLLP